MDNRVIWALIEWKEQWCINNPTKYFHPNILNEILHDWEQHKLKSGIRIIEWRIKMFDN
jgi:hypothetical protein